MTHRGDREHGWALVTGASGGIGEEIARDLAARGWNLVLTARREAKLEGLAEEFRAAAGVEVLILPADLSEPGASGALLGDLKRLDIHVEILVNNAGIGHYGEYLKRDLEDHEALLTLNVHAVMVLLRGLVPGMVDRGRGRVLNVASTAAFQPGPLMASYYASKAFMLSLSEALRDELRMTGVTVTTLCPGPTRSDFHVRAGMRSSPLVTTVPIPSSRSVARYGVRAMLRGKGIAVPGLPNRLHLLALRFMPRGLVPGIVRRVQQTRREESASGP